MTWLFGGWEPTIAPAPPVLNNPTLLTTQKRISGGGTGIITNRYANASTTKCPFVAKDGGDIPSLTFADMDLNGCAGLFRAQNGHIGKIDISRISLLNGRYAPGVICGLLLISGTDVDEVEINDCVYDRVEPITSPGDIYGFFTGGGHDETHIWGSCQKVTIRNCRASNLWVNYVDQSKYPNSDFIVGEKTIANVLIDRCHAIGGADAGVDGKGPNWRVQDSIYEDVRESFKWWESGQDGAVYSKNPRVAHWVLPAQGKSVERVVEFAGIYEDNPTKCIVDLQKRPHTLRLLKGFLNVDLEHQVLAHSEPEAFGSIITLGDKTITINKPVTMLTEAL